MKNPSRLVICPKCSEAIDFANIIEHLNSHNPPQSKEQQIGEPAKPEGSALAADEDKATTGA